VRRTVRTAINCEQFQTVTYVRMRVTVSGTCKVQKIQFLVSYPIIIPFHSTTFQSFPTISWIFRCGMAAIMHSTRETILRPLKLFSRRLVIPMFYMEVQEPEVRKNEEP